MSRYKFEFKDPFGGVIFSVPLEVADFYPGTDELTVLTGTANDNVWGLKCRHPQSHPNADFQIQISKAD